MPGFNHAKQWTVKKKAQVETRIESDLWQKERSKSERVDLQDGSAACYDAINTIA